MQSVSVEERRNRLAVRHLLAPGPRPALTGPVEAADALVGLHATDPASVYLAAWARVPGFVPAQLDAALYDDRTAVKHLCMRRTLFVLPTARLPMVQAAVSDAVAATQRRRLIVDVENGGLARDGARWLRQAARETLAALDEMGPATGAQLSRAVPRLQAKLAYGEGRTWGGEVGVASRVLTVLAVQGRIRRGRPSGGWTSSQHRWEPGSPPPVEPERDAQRQLVERWLRSFGPATVGDVAWWTGLGVTKIRDALEALDLVEVDVDGVAGVCLADDVAPTDPPGPWVALLPWLDPTPMGWKHRGWYLGEHAPRLFDRSGNIGATVWADGRVVGGWSQRPTGEVAVELFEDVGTDTRSAVDEAVDQLQRWLGDRVVTPRFPTPLDKELRR